MQLVHNRLPSHLSEIRTGPSFGVTYLVLTVNRIAVYSDCPVLYRAIAERTGLWGVQRDTDAYPVWMYAGTVRCGKGRPSEAAVTTRTRFPETELASGAGKVQK